MKLRVFITALLCIVVAMASGQKLPGGIELEKIKYGDEEFCGEREPIYTDAEGNSYFLIEPCKKKEPIMIEKRDQNLKLLASGPLVGDVEVEYLFPENDLLTVYDAGISKNGKYLVLFLHQTAEKYQVREAIFKMEYDLNSLEFIGGKRILDLNRSVEKGNSYKREIVASENDSIIELCYLELIISNRSDRTVEVNYCTIDISGECTESASAMLTFNEKMSLYIKEIHYDRNGDVFFVLKYQHIDNLGFGGSASIKEYDLLYMFDVKENALEMITPSGGSKSKNSDEGRLMLVDGKMAFLGTYSTEGTGELGFFMTYVNPYEDGYDYYRYWKFDDTYNDIVSRGISAGYYDKKGGAEKIFIEDVLVDDDGTLFFVSKAVGKYWYAIGELLVSRLNIDEKSNKMLTKGILRRGNQSTRNVESARYWLDNGDVHILHYEIVDNDKKTTYDDLRGLSDVDDRNTGIEHVYLPFNNNDAIVRTMIPGYFGGKYILSAEPYFVGAHSRMFLLTGGDSKKDHQYHGLKVKY